MQSLNLALFDALAAGFAPDPVALSLAVFTTAAAPWLAAAAMALAAFRRPGSGPYLLIALAVAVATAMLTKDIAAALNSPRPFMAGLSPSHIAHGARGGLPSTHAAVMFAIASLLLLRPALRATGVAVAVLAAVTAWSRVYLGIHFPFDIVAGAVLGGVVAGAAALVLSTVDGHRDHASDADWNEAPSARAAAHPLARLLLHGNASRYAVLICAAAALGIGLALPDAFVAHLVRDGGALETGTLALYLVALVGVLATRPASFSMADKAALAVVLCVLAVREADMLDLRSAGATAVALPLMVAAVWLALQFRAGWRRVEARPDWRTPAVTVMMFMAVALFATLLEQTPETIAELGLRGRLPKLAWLAMLSLEEMLELLLPVLALLALLQVRLGRPRLRTATA